MKPLAKEFTESKAGDILRAAEHLFALHGYDGVSMNAVAQEAGVSKANVFHHFGSKEELYMAVLRQVRQELTRDLATLDAAPEPDLARNLARIGALYLRHFLANEDRVRLFMRENMEKRPGQAKALADNVFAKDHAVLAAVMRAAAEGGHLRADINPNMPMVVLMAACIFYFQSFEILTHFPGTEDFKEPERFIHQVVDILLHGITARPND